MNKNRLEAFSDGVFAIIVTIMVLEMKAPHGAEWSNLSELIPKFLSYLFSFIMVWIYWNNHHHLFQTVQKVNGKVLLANGILLFCLSLQPFVTAWMGENNMQQNTVVLYGVLLEMCGIAYTILQKTIGKNQLHDADLKKAIDQGEKKGIFSLFAYAAAIAIAFYDTRISCLIFVLVALIWFVPGKNIERILGGNE